MSKLNLKKKISLLLLFTQNIFRRNTLQEQLRKSWKLGLFLALASGVLFTGNNCMIQYFQVDPLEILLVRSLFQVL